MVPKSDASLARIRELEQEVLALRREKEGQGDVHAETSEDDTYAFMDPVQVREMFRMQSLMEHQVRLTSLRVRLDLSPQQVQQIETYQAELDRVEVEFLEETMEAQKEGKLPVLVYPDIQDEATFMQSILSAEQWSLYEQMEEDRRKAEWEQQAMYELSELQAIVSLNEAQKDRLFEVFYDRASGVHSEVSYTANDIEAMLEAHSEHEGASEAVAMTDQIVGAPQGLDWATKELERKLAAVEDTLTPEQLELYRLQLEMQNEVTRSMMVDFPGFEGTAVLPNISSDSEGEH